MDRIQELINIKELMTTGVAFVPRLGAALLVLLFFWLIYRTSRPPLRGILQFKKYGGVAALVRVSSDLGDFEEDRHVT